MFEGFVSPFAEADRRTQYTNQAWDAVRNDPASAAVIAGLSMLAGNDGERSLGQLVGRAGLDTLEGMRSLDAQRRAQARFAERNRPAASAVPRTGSTQAAGVPSGLSPVLLSKEQGVFLSGVSPSAGFVPEDEAVTSAPQPRTDATASARRSRRVRPRTTGRS